MSDAPYRGPYSSKIGLFAIGRSPINVPFVPVPDNRRVVFSLPEYQDTFELPEAEERFAVPEPEGWSY